MMELRESTMGLSHIPLTPTLNRPKTEVQICFVQQKAEFGAYF